MGDPCSCPWVTLPPATSLMAQASSCASRVSRRLVSALPGISTTGIRHIKRAVLNLRIGWGRPDQPMPAWPGIVSAGAAGALPGLLIGGAVLNFQMYMNLYATDPQQAVALTYAQAEMIDAAAGVYDPNSPYYVPPNPTWQAPAFQPGPWPGDPVQSNSFWGTVQSIGSYIANSIITPAGETPPYTGPVNGDLPPVPYVAETLGVQQILAGQTPDPFIFGGQPVPYLAETQSFQQIMAGQDPSIFGFGAQPVPYVLDTQNVLQIMAGQDPSTFGFGAQPVPYVLDTQNVLQIMAGQDPSTFGFGAQPVPYVAETLAVQGALSAGAGGGAPSVFDTGTSAVPYVAETLALQGALSGGAAGGAAGGMSSV